MQKEEQYHQIYKVIQAVTESETDKIANLANTAAILKEKFNHHWIGFYLVETGSQQLVLGPFQGPLACTRIPFGKGVCGSAWESGKTYIVGNVHEFPGHIACSSLSNSEIVIPIFKNNQVCAVLDIDSTNFSQFDEVDQKWLEKVCELLSAFF